MAQNKIPTHVPQHADENGNVATYDPRFEKMGSRMQQRKVALLMTNAFQLMDHAAQLSRRTIKETAENIAYNSEKFTSLLEMKGRLKAMQRDYEIAQEELLSQIL